MATAAEIKSFINRLGALAVAECNRRIAAGKGFVLPSVCIAQSALETGWGTSGLMVKANAFFGIKAGGSWTGGVYRADTWEVANGEAYNTTANFRAYPSVAASVTDYYDLISNSRYSNALSYGLDSSKWLSPKACISAIWSGGYATDTLYVEKIMNTVNARNLAEWDKKIDGVTFSDIATYFGERNLVNNNFTAGKLSVEGNNLVIVADESYRTTKEAINLTAGTYEITPGPIYGSYELALGTKGASSANITRFSGGVVNDNNGVHYTTHTLTVNEDVELFIEFKSNVADLTGTWDLPADTSVKLIKQGETLISSEEINVNGIAYFVKVE